jgi:hypothetical protein
MPIDEILGDLESPEVNKEEDEDKQYSLDELYKNMKEALGNVRVRPFIIVDTGYDFFESVEREYDLDKDEIAVIFQQLEQYDFSQKVTIGANTAAKDKTVDNTILYFTLKYVKKGISFRTSMYIKDIPKYYSELLNSEFVYSDDLFDTIKYTIKKLDKEKYDFSSSTYNYSWPAKSSYKIKEIEEKIHSLNNLKKILEGNEKHAN